MQLIDAALAQLPDLDPVAGLLLLFVVMVVQVVVPPIPAELIVIAAGHTYGVTATAIVAGAGLGTGSIAVYGIGFWLRRRFGRWFDGPRVTPVIRQLRRYGPWLLWIRILPYNPSDTISYAAGILRLDVRTFLAITAVTSWVRCLTLAWLGTTLIDARTALQGAGVLVASAAAAHYLVYRHRGGGEPAASREDADDGT